MQMILKVDRDAPLPVLGCSATQGGDKLKKMTHWGNYLLGISNIPYSSTHFHENHLLFQRDVGVSDTKFINCSFWIYKHSCTPSSSKNPSLNPPLGSEIH
jgi:hypothetical protein